MVLTANSIIYIEGGKKVGIAVNGWASRVSNENFGFEVPKESIEFSEFDAENGH